MEEEEKKKDEEEKEEGEQRRRRPQSLANLAQRSTGRRAACGRRICGR